MPALVQNTDIGRPLPPPLLPLRTPPPAPGLCLGQLVASSRWCVAPGLGVGGGEGGVRSPAPACVRRGAVRRSPAPAGLVSGAVHGEVGAVCCHAEIDWYESFPPRTRWSLSSCMACFFEAAAAVVCGAFILCVNQSTVSLG